MISISETDSVPPMTLGELEKLCAGFEDTGATLEALLADFEKDLQEVKLKHLPALKRQAGVVARRQAELIKAVEAGAHLFEKRRTLTIHGIKVGFTHSNGKLTFNNPAAVVRAIKQFYGEAAGTYIHSSEEPDKDALKKLEPSALKALGCRIEGAGDQVFCERVAGDVAKLIDQLMEKLVEAAVDAKP